MTTAIEFQHVQKDFNGQTVIPDLNLMVDQGELFVLVGTSGSGKTTSLKMINRLEPLTAGKSWSTGPTPPRYQYGICGGRWGTSCNKSLYFQL